jgi:hypothetical protein
LKTNVVEDCATRKPTVLWRAVLATRVKYDCLLNSSERQVDAIRAVCCCNSKGNASACSSIQHERWARAKKQQVATIGIRIKLRRSSVDIKTWLICLTYSNTTLSRILKKMM